MCNRQNSQPDKSRPGSGHSRMWNRWRNTVEVTDNCIIDTVYRYLASPTILMFCIILRHHANVRTGARLALTVVPLKEVNNRSASSVVFHIHTNICVCVCVLTLFVPSDFGPCFTEGRGQGVEKTPQCRTS